MPLSNTGSGSSMYQSISNNGSDGIHSTMKDSPSLTSVMDGFTVRGKSTTKTSNYNISSPN